MYVTKILQKPGDPSYIVFNVSHGLKTSSLPKEKKILNNLLYAALK